GPCTYSGDSMQQIHDGMAVTERDFNHLVDLLINAMYQADVPHPVQNQLLARLAPLRKDIIYR
ncbi:MAG: group 1 truncated hemoglobin, partial [Pseudomonadota bacterium]|nr:group 1 truncated hemoglobin [Pseudomonadota bacterium]